MQFKKIKYTKTNGLEIKYDEAKENKDDSTSIMEHSIKCKDEPHPDLKEALQALVAWVQVDEGLPKKAEITITGVSLLNNEETLIVTHTKKIKSGTTARNSGRVSMDEEDSDTTTLFSLVDALKKEATAYVKEGKRAQLQMAFDGQE